MRVILGFALTTALGVTVVVLAPSCTGKKSAPVSPNAPPSGGHQVPHASRPQNATPMTGSLPSLPDPRSIAYEGFFRDHLEALPILCDLYYDQYMSDRRAVAHSIAEVESHTGLHIPRGDVVGFERGSMIATLMTIRAQRWGAATGKVRSAISALDDQLVAVERSKAAADWIGTATQLAYTSPEEAMRWRARHRGPTSPEREERAGGRTFVPPWAWPEQAPENWPTNSVYVKPSVYVKMGQEARLFAYNSYKRIEKGLEDDLSIIAADLALYEKAPGLRPADSVDRLREEKRSLVAQLPAAARITSNLRFYCVWSMYNGGQRDR